MPQINKKAASFAPPTPGARAAGAIRGRWSPARTSVTALFCLDGFLFAGWVSRIPEIKAQVHAAPAALGLALLCISFGAVATMPLVGRACVRFGNAPVTVATAAMESAALALPPQTHSVLVLGGALLLFGSAFGGVNVGANSAAVDLVAHEPGTRMPSFHAAFSLGGLLGSLLGGLAAQYLTPAVHLALAGLLGLAATAWAGAVLFRHPIPSAYPKAAPEAPDAAPHAQPRQAEKSTAAAVAPSAALLVVLLGLVALCDAYGEGALSDWTTLHLADDLHSSPAVAAWGFSVFSVAMTLGRAGGSRALARFGPTRLLAGGAALAAVGMLLAAELPVLPLVLAGLLLVGLGLANIFPLAMDRAGALRGARGVATASTFGYGGMVLGPPVIGFLAQFAGLPLALLSVSLLAALSGTLALVVRRATAASSGATAAAAPMEPSSAGG